jgi:hypothetical protein
MNDIRERTPMILEIAILFLLIALNIYLITLPQPHAPNSNKIRHQQFFDDSGRPYHLIPIAHICPLI